MSGMIRLWCCVIAAASLLAMAGCGKPKVDWDEMDYSQLKPSHGTTCSDDISKCPVGGGHR